VDGVGGWDGEIGDAILEKDNAVDGVVSDDRERNIDVIIIKYQPF